MNSLRCLLSFFVHCLPNIKELQSIVNYSYSPTATNSSFVGPAIDSIFDCTSITNEAGNNDYPYYWSSTSARFQAGSDFYYAWYVAFGMAVNKEGEDFHGAGAVRYDTKALDGPAGEDAERYYNYVRLVRGGQVSTSTDDFNFRPFDLDVYPNPSQNLVTLSSDMELRSITIYNLSGKLVLKQYPNQNKATINFGALPNGLYFVKAIAKDGIAVQKIIVER